MKVNNAFNTIQNHSLKKDTWNNKKSHAQTNPAMKTHILPSDRVTDGDHLDVVPRKLASGQSRRCGSKPVHVCLQVPYFPAVAVAVAEANFASFSLTL